MSKEKEVIEYQLDLTRYIALVDKLVTLNMDRLEQYDAFTHEELHQVDEDTKVPYLSPVGEEIYNEITYEVEKLLSKAGIKREKTEYE